MHLYYDCSIFANGWKIRKNNFIRAFHENERQAGGWIVRFGLSFSPCLAGGGADTHPDPPKGRE